MSNTTAETPLISAVRYDHELQGNRGEKIREVMRRKANKGIFLTSRATILQLIDAGLEAELKKQ